VAVSLLQAAAASGWITLIMDGTKVSFHHQLDNIRDKDMRQAPAMK
jgi:hypothetical protein